MSDAPDREELLRLLHAAYQGFRGGRMSIEDCDRVEDVLGISHPRDAAYALAERRKVRRAGRVGP